VWGESAWGKSSAGTDTYSVEPSLLPPPNRFGRPNLRFAEGCSGGRCRARDRGSRSSAQAAPEALRAIQITLPVCRRAAIGASALPRMLPIATIGTDAARYALASRARAPPEAVAEKRRRGCEARVPGASPLSSRSRTASGRSLCSYHPLQRTRPRIRSSQTILKCL